MTIWIDTDIALGTPSGDVDDGFAVVAVLASSVEVLGISVVDGNTDAASALWAAQDLTARFPHRSAVEIVPQSDAARRLAQLPEGAHVLALGPLSNIAAALRLDPTLASRAKLSLVGTVSGSAWRHPILRHFCLNFRHDPKAADEVLACRWQRLRIFPLDVVRRLRAGRRELEQLATVEPIGRHLADGSRRWVRQAPWRYQSFAFPVWDLVAALDAIDLLVEPRYQGARLIGFDAAASFDRFVELISAS